MTDPTPPHRRSPMEHERDACPYCAEGVLTIAWLAGAESKRERTRTRIEALEAENRRLRAERHPRVEELEEHIANMLQMQECACGHDDPMDVCLGHATILKRIEALEAENRRLWEIIREAHDAMKDGSDATAWAFLHAAVKAETEARAVLKGEGE